MEQYFRGQRVEFTTNSGRKIKGRFRGTVGSNRILLSQGRDEWGREVDSVEKDKVTPNPYA